MKHYVYFKYGRIYYERVYELYSDYETAKAFQTALSKQYNKPIICCEVL